jgi:hypothetical protein
MQFPESIIPALVGALAAVATSIVGSLVGYRTLRAEYRSRHRLELIGKQIAACEDLWAALLIGSQSSGENRVIHHRDGKSFVSVPDSRQFYDDLTRTFNSSSGLYYSRELRDDLFALRGFVESDLMSLGGDDADLVEISNSKAKKFDGLVRNLRVAIRREIGVEDLKAATEGPV